MLAEDARLLRESDDGVALKRTLLKVLKAPQEGDLRAVEAVLGNETFLLRLDDADTYRTTTINLRLNKVVRALGDARSPASDQTLVNLTASPTFTAHPLRVKLLILGLARLELPPAPALDFWRRFAQPGSSLATDVALATSLNRRMDALRVHAEMIRSEGHPFSLRVSWLRRFLLPVRDDDLVVRMCESLLSGPLSTPLRHRLLEVLFDFKPDRWYKSCRHPEPPNRRLASDEAKRGLERIARGALADPELPPYLFATLESALASLPGPERASDT